MQRSSDVEDDRVGTEGGADVSRPGTLDCCRDGDDPEQKLHRRDCDWIARKRREFRPGLYRHYKGGVYHAICLVTHHDTRLPMVLYESYTYGGTNVRPLVGWPGDPDGWIDEIETLPAEALPNGMTRVFPSKIFRFEFVGELPSDEKIADRVAAFEGLRSTTKVSG